MYCVRVLCVQGSLGQENQIDIPRKTLYKETEQGK